MKIESPMVVSPLLNTIIDPAHEVEQLFPIDIGSSNDWKNIDTMNTIRDSLLEGGLCQIFYRPSFHFWANVENIGCFVQQGCFIVLR
jgi:hypothetical protein